MPAKALEALFSPRSLCIVGATDRSFWFHLIKDALITGQFAGPVYVMNRSGISLAGYPGVKSWDELPQAVDAAFLMVPANAVKDAFQQAVAAGVRSIVILTSGFAESGPEGKAAQDELVELAREAGVRFLGPNSMGFHDIGRGMLLSSFQTPARRASGGIGIVSQSGAVGSEILMFAELAGIGMSFVAGTGNEASVTLSDIVDYLVDHEPTRVIAIWAESIRSPDVFREAVRRAALAGKPVVMLKTGSSALSAQVALSHTGSLVGDDRVIDAICDAYNIVRVYSVEELVMTAAVLDRCFPITQEGVAILSVSGGACSLSSDLAEKTGLPLPQFSEATVTRLKEALPSFASSLNPLDMTGIVVGSPEAMESIVAAAAADPAIGLVIAVVDTPLDEVLPRQTASYQAIGRGLASGRSKGAIVNLSMRTIKPEHRAALEAAGAPPAFSCLDSFIRGVTRALAWQKRSSQELPPSIAQSPTIVASGFRLQTEVEILEALSEAGVAIPEMILARSEEAAVAAGNRLEGPLALKIVSKDIAHKSDIGGVKLNICGEAAISAAYREIIESVRHKCPNARLDGVVVARMQPGEVELLVGVKRDEQWGCVLTIGFGGIWTEILRDTTICLLPAGREQVVQMLTSLRGSALLFGVRGRTPLAVGRVVDSVMSIIRFAERLGNELEALEVNPLAVSERGAVALDALIVWKNSSNRR